MKYLLAVFAVYMENAVTSSGMSVEMETNESRGGCCWHYGGVRTRSAALKTDPCPDEDGFASQPM